MLVNSEGKLQTEAVEFNNEEKWMIIEGCNYDPTIVESTEF